MRYYKTVENLVERALRGEDVDFLLGQLGIALSRLPKKDYAVPLRNKFSQDMQKGIFRRHKLAPYLIASIYELLRDERDKKIHDTRLLTSMRREDAENTSMRRFAGWVTSIPASKAAVNKREAIKFIADPIKQLPKHEKLIVDDQKRKMESGLDYIVAKENDALGYYWHSMFRVPNYDYRVEHKHNDIDGLFIILKDSWAYKQGLIKKGNQLFQEEIEQPGQLPNCKCSAKYVYALSEIPNDCLTIKGLEFTKG